MMVFNYMIAASWIAFIAYWLITALGAKKDAVRQIPIWLSLAARLLLGLTIGISLAQPSVAHFELVTMHFIGPIGHTIGALLCVTGIAVAIWARAYLGKNWCDQPSIKAGHELVTTGPYHLIRHPVYTGVLLAIAGTALATGIAEVVVFVVAGCIFFYRIKIEERILTQTFPEAYPGYLKRTKALIPYVL